MVERDEMKARMSEFARLRRGTETSLNNSDQSLASLDMAARPLHGSDSTSDISVRLCESRGACGAEMMLRHCLATSTSVVVLLLPDSSPGGILSTTPSPLVDPTFLSTRLGYQF